MIKNCFKILVFSLINLMIVNEVDSQRIIRGNVSDGATGESLIGANISVKNADGLGTISDYEGNFELEVDMNAVSIIVSYIGYQTKEVSIKNVSEVNITLLQGEVLDELVIVGYGTVKKEDVTGSLQSVSSKDFNKGAITSPQQLLAGKVPGVAITNSGDPGGGASIRIRGESSLTASNDPLIVVDGVPLDNTNTAGGRNNLNVINPNDIESITVLKDASATAIYGNRASAGVLLITTKKGAIGQGLRVGYNGNVSIGNIRNKVDILTADEFRALVEDQFPDRTELLGEADTDWQDEIYQQAIGTDHNLSLSGGLGNVPFRVSLGYTDMNGLLKTDNFNRLTGAVNVNPKLLDSRLQMNLGLKMMRSNNDFADRGAIGNANSFNPTLAPLNSDGRFGGFTTPVDINGRPLALAPRNPLALINQVDDESTVDRTILNGSFDYRFKFLPELRANLNLAYDISNSDGFKLIDTIAAFSPEGVDNTYSETKDNQLLEFYLNYVKDIDKNTVDVMAGYSWQRIGFEASNFDSNLLGTVSNEKNEARELYLLSFFGRTNYDYDDKLLFTFTLRADGTSRFAEGNKWGIFPATALGYKLLDRQSKFLNYTKLRLGWGITGQQDIGTNYYAALGAYEGSEPNANYQFGDSFIQTLRANGYDGEITWETTTTYNLGADVGIVRDRLSLSLDLYQRFTEDLFINSIPLAAGTNLTNVLDTNVGNMENKGVELSLNITPVTNDNLTWTLNLNGAYNKNEITKLRATDDPDYEGILTGGIAGGVGSNIQIHTVGNRPYMFYVFEQEYDQDGNLLEGQFVDRNGDGLVNNDDKYRLFSRQPDFTFGFASSLSWKSFDFSFAGRANLGNYMYNNVQTDIGWLNRVKNITGALTNVHSSAVTNNVLQQSSVTFSDHFIENASFLRMDHITLGYDLAPLVKKNIRLYGTVQNPFVVTNYSGLDPEEFSGIDNNLYPRPRTIVIGVNANF